MAETRSSPGMRERVAGACIPALRVGVGTGDPRWVPGVRSWLRFFEDCNRKEPLAWMTVSRW